MQNPLIDQLTHVPFNFHKKYYKQSKLKYKIIKCLEDNMEENYGFETGDRLYIYKTLVS